MKRLILVLLAAALLLGLVCLVSACGEEGAPVAIETAKPAATVKPTPTPKPTATPKPSSTTEALPGCLIVTDADLSMAEPTPEPPLQTLGPAPSEEAPAPDRAAPAADPTPTPAPERDYVINTNTGKFHVPSCSSVKDIKPGNRQDVHMTRDAVIAQGWQPCGKCKP